MPVTDSPLRYPGGKTKLYRQDHYQSGHLFLNYIGKPVLELKYSAGQTKGW